MMRLDFKRLGVQILAFISLCVTLSDKDSQLIHKLNEGVTINGRVLFQGDIVHDHLISTVFGSREKRALPRQAYRIWEKNTIPYLVDKNLGLRKLHALESAMRSWEQNTCIRFREKLPSDVNYVRFSSGRGCFATIGQGDGEQLLSLGKGCGTPGFALHELAHVIGFFHEQSRPDRDDYVDVIWANIRSDKREQFAKYNSEEIDPRGIPYDYLSITHYGPYDFRSEPGLQTLRVKKLAENPADMGQRRYLSGYDIIGANTLYQCTQHLEEQCKYGTKYVDTQVREMKHYACKLNGIDWDICSMPVMKTKKFMVCNWNKTQYELGKKKVEPTDSWLDNDVDPDPTSESDLCIREVPYDIEIEVPCGDTTCKKTVTKNRSVSGPCWTDQAQEDSLFNNDQSSWSGWSPWSPCNRKCGRGMQLRFRMCSRDRDGTKSNTCPGYRRAVKSCCEGPCYKTVTKPGSTDEKVKVISRDCPAVEDDNTSPEHNAFDSGEDEL